MERKKNSNLIKEFIEGLEIERVWMSRIHSEIFFEKEKINGPIEISFNQESEYENYEEDKSIVKVESHFVFSAQNDQIAKIEIHFKIDYETKLSFDDEIFKDFIDQLLPAHIWPYTREVIQNLTMRMGLPPLVLPVWKSPAIQMGSSKTKPTTRKKKSTRKKRAKPAVNKE